MGQFKGKGEQVQPINFHDTSLMLRSPAVYPDQHANTNNPWSVWHLARWPAEADDVVYCMRASNSQHCRLRCHGLLECY